MLGNAAQDDCALTAGTASATGPALRLRSWTTIRFKLFSLFL